MVAHSTALLKLIQRKIGISNNEGKKTMNIVKKI